MLDQNFDTVLHLIRPEVFDNKVFKYLNDRFLPAHGLELRVDFGGHFLEVRQDLFGDNGSQALLKETARLVHIVHSVLLQVSTHELVYKLVQRVEDVRQVA